MFGLFKTREQKQEEFIQTITNSRGWSRDFYPHYSCIAEHKVLRIEITSLDGDSKPEFDDWKIIVYHYDRPTKIMTHATSEDFGKDITSALRAIHHFCWRNYMSWRKRHGFATYSEPIPEYSFRIEAAG